VQKLDTRQSVQRANPPHPDTMEHRFGRRYSCGTSVTLSAGGGLVGVGHMMDVSLSGTFVETALDLPLSTLVMLEKSCGERRGVVLAGLVVRKDADGIGVEWCDTPSRSICETLDCQQRCGAAPGD